MNHDSVHNQEYREIQYPYAMLGNRIIDIENAGKRTGFTCIGCEQGMVPVMGQKVAWHFRHTPESGPCSTEETLHKMAQALTVMHFQEAQKNGREYRLLQICTRCRGYKLVINLAGPNARITTEDARIVPGTRADIVVRDGAQAWILEIIDTHPMEEKTIDLVEQSGFPLFTKNIHYPDDLRDLGQGFRADPDGINIEADCQACLEYDRQKEIRRQEDEARRQREKGERAEQASQDQEKLQKAQEERQKAQEKLQRENEEKQARTRALLLAAEDAYQGKFKEWAARVESCMAGMDREQQTEPRFTRWIQEIYDPLDNPLEINAETREQIFANAIILTEIGFRQNQGDAPEEFRYDIPGGIILHTDLGIRPWDIPLEKQPARLRITGAPQDSQDNNNEITQLNREIISLKLKLGQYPERDRRLNLNHHLAGLAERRLREFGVNIRAEGTAEGRTDGEDPTEYVDPDMLAELVQWGKWERETGQQDDPWNSSKEILFPDLPEDVRKNLEELPKPHGRVIRFKNCRKCGEPAVINMDICKWAGATDGWGIDSQVEHLDCNRPYVKTRQEYPDIFAG